MAEKFVGERRREVLLLEFGVRATTRFLLTSISLATLPFSAVHAQAQVGAALGGLTLPPPPQTINPTPADISLQPTFGGVAAPPAVKTEPAQAAQPAQPQAAPAQADQISLQWRGQYEGGAEFSTRLIRTQQAWAGLLSGLNKAAPHKLDESHEMAVFIAIGERSTGGFKPAVLSAKVIDGTMVVEYTDGKPAPDMFVTQVISHPWIAAIIPATSLPVVMKKSR